MIKSTVKTIAVTIILWGLFVNMSIAQGIASEDNSWNIIARDVILNDADTEFQIIDGDTIVDGHDYKIMWRSYYTVGGWYQSGLIREDSGIVYYIRPDGMKGILYNFNLDAGDTCTIVNFCSNYKILVHISDRDTVEYFGIERLRLRLIDNNPGYTDQWIQGIGSIHGPIHTLMQHCNPPYFRWDLLCYHHDDSLQYIMPGYTDCIYTNVGIREPITSDDVIIYPNPAREKFEVRSAEFGVEKIEIFDLQSRKLIEQHFPAGEKNVEMTVSKLLPGTYICKISYGNQAIIRIILIK